MRVLFVTYCFSGGSGQALIGVYKRGLRVAMAVRQLGHEVFFFCTGREAYRDELTSRAEAHLNFVTLPFWEAGPKSVERLRQEFRAGVEALQPHLIVVGEAPLAGAMLEASLCAAELEIPLVVLDNAYNPGFPSAFDDTCGPLVDAIILAAPSSYLAPSPPAHLFQVPPYIESDVAAARALVTGPLGLKGHRLVTTLAYDSKVESLGRSLIAHLEDTDCEALFLARLPEPCQLEVDRLPESLRRRIRVLPLPADPLLFGLLECSALAVVKYGFMQVSECMALRTPTVCVYHEGPRWLDTLPAACQPFIHMTADAVAAPDTVAAARRLLAVDPDAMRDVHHGGFQAAARSASILERVASTPRRDTRASAYRLGFSAEHLLAALRVLEGPEVDACEPRSVRAMQLRRGEGFVIHSVVCGYVVGSERRTARLWVSQLESAELTREELAAAEGTRRRVLYGSPEHRLMIEVDSGQALLPPL